MAVTGAVSFTLQVPDVEVGAAFYKDAGLEVTTGQQIARCMCPGRSTDAVILIGGAKKKRLDHITLRAEGLEAIARAVPSAGGRVLETPDGYEPGGIWIADPHGMRIHLIETGNEEVLAEEPPFLINGPGRIVRTHRSAVLPLASYQSARPRRLGHILLFSPDVPASVRFVTDALGMGLADHAEDVIAFCCARKDSDHHVVAFAKSPGVGFHHASFQVGDPDEVGRGGRALVNKAQKGDWGFGRHTIGSNFFHYIQDPWGSWFEYYSDMDHIDDYDLWTPTNYAMEDSLANWGPKVPADFVHNYEVDEKAFA